MPKWSELKAQEVEPQLMQVVQIRTKDYMAFVCPDCASAVSLAGWSASTSMPGRLTLEFRCVGESCGTEFSLAIHNVSNPYVDHAVIERARRKS